MAIETNIAPRQKWWNLLYLVLCLALGLWGLYDYAITIPRRTADAERYQAAETRLKELEALAADGGSLTEAERGELAEVNSTLASFGGDVPKMPRTWDRPVQLWLYVIGCGVLGTPYFVWSLWSISRKKFRLEDDGTLVSPAGTWPADQIADIDMSRWMDKSMAWVVHRDGTRVLLDDYKYKDMHLIVGSLAHRFHPDDWTTEAKLVKKDEPSDEEAAVDPISERITTPDDL
ncbi:MAG: hypothetical protein KDA22_07455 [Phycisphaerales bacterium]|nr:hypothetical protein [Phycisphaerales bacterium]